MIWRKQKREPRDPTWIFSTWPIPHWTGTSCVLTVTAADGHPNIRATSDYVYPGPEEQPRLQGLLDRLGSVGGSVYMRDGTFVLADTLYLNGLTDSIIVGNRFVRDDASTDV